MRRLGRWRAGSGPVRKVSKSAPEVVALSDRSLQLVRVGDAVGHLQRRSQQSIAFLGRLAVPAAAVLFVQRDKLPGAIGAGWSPGVGQQQQRVQSFRRRLTRQQGDEQAAQADGFHAKVGSDQLRPPLALSTLPFASQHVQCLAPGRHVEPSRRIGRDAAVGPDLGRRQNAITGRTSTAPSQAAGILAARATASSRSAHSSR